MLDVPFAGTLRNIDALLHEFGIEIDHEMVRCAPSLPEKIVTHWLYYYRVIGEGEKRA